MRVVYVYSDTPEEWNCAQWRMQMPHDALQRAGHDTSLFYLSEFIGQGRQVRLACESADIIIIQRNLLGPVLNEILLWRRKGIPVVVDFDDAYDQLPTTHLVYKHWIQGLIRYVDGDSEVIKPSPLDQFRAGMRLVSAAIMPNVHLQNEWAVYTPTYLIPNYPDLRDYQNVKHKAHEGIIIGWGGSVSHWESVVDATGVLTALKRVAQAIPEVKIVIQTSDQRISKALHLSESQKLYRPWVKYKDWPQSMADWDISLAIVHGPYDTHRSIIHLIEPLMLGDPIPVIASNQDPYAPYGQYVSLTKNTPKAWEATILEVVSQVYYKTLDLTRSQAWAQSYGIDQHVTEIVKIYQEIIDHEHSTTSLS
jgi:hypothetical protein